MIDQNKWIYRKSNIISLDDFGNNTPFGFIYITTHNPTGKKYLGKKSLFHTLNKKLGKKELAEQPITRGRNKLTKKIIKESDWLNYYGSEEFIKQKIKEKCQHEFHREIVDIALNKKHLTYLETKHLFINNVLESDKWLNSNILGKFYKNDFN
jgi:hypothetical protein